MTLFPCCIELESQLAFPIVDGWGSRRALDLGASSRSSHLLLAASRHLCQDSRERKELCALAQHTLEVNATEGKVFAQNT